MLATSRFTYICIWYTREHASTRRLFRFIDPSRMITGQQVLVNFQVETKEGRGEVRVSSIERNRPWSWVVLFRKLRDDEWPWKRRRDTSSRLEPGQLYITTCSIATRHVYFSRTRYRYECEESDHSSKARIELSSIDVNTRLVLWLERISRGSSRYNSLFPFRFVNFHPDDNYDL